MAQQSVQAILRQQSFDRPQVDAVRKDRLTEEPAVADRS